jgi:hypothetical protein
MLNTLKNWKIKAAVDKVPGWLLIGFSALGGGIWGYIQNNSADVLKDASSGNWKGVEGIGVHALIAGISAFVLYLKTDPWAQAEKNARELKVPLPPLPILLLVGGLSLGGLATTGLALETSSCTPAQTAELKSIEAVVLADVEAGDQDPQIVADVVKIIAQNADPNSPAVIAFATSLAYDAIAFLLDEGVIPPQFLAAAQAHRASLKAAKAKLEVQ